jgi:hypothetical protein
MRKLLLLPLLCSLVLEIGCGTEPSACAAVLTNVTAYVANRTAQPLSVSSVTDTIRRTREVLHVVVSATDTLPVGSTGVVPVFPDTLSETLAAFGDDVIVVVTADSRFATGVYRLARHGCSVERLAGPDTLVFQ